MGGIYVRDSLTGWISLSQSDVVDSENYVFQRIQRHHSMGVTPVDVTEFDTKSKTHTWLLMSQSYNLTSHLALVPRQCGLPVKFTLLTSLSFV